MGNQLTINPDMDIDNSVNDTKTVRFHGRFFMSIACNNQINLGVSNLYVAIILHYLVFWVTFNERIGNKNALVDNVYWVRASRTKISDDLYNIVSSRHIYRILQGLIKIGFIEVHKNKAGSANTAYQYRPTTKCLDYLKANNDLDWVVYEAQQYADYRKAQKNNTNSSKIDNNSFEDYFRNNQLF